MRGRININSVLADLDMVESYIDCAEKLNKVYNIFEENIKIPGIIATKNGRFYHMISKTRFYQMMSKQYRFELFSQRSVDFFIDGNNTGDDLLLAESVTVIEAAKKALLRDDKNRYEPVIVLFSNGVHKLLPVQVLLLAQNEIQTHILDFITEANEFKKDVLRIAAHDLRNPLNVVIGFTSLIKNNIVEIEKAKMYAEQILSAAVNMDNLINDFLVASINDAADFDLNFSVFNITACVEKVISSFAIAISAKQQEIIYYPSVAPINLNADMNKIIEVLENLISNAIKYSEFGKKIMVSVYSLNDSVIIKVVDEGPGFTATDKEMMFTKLQKLSAKPTGNETSTGLGLYIAKRIIARHEGQIWVESEPGLGSSFFISLPLYFGG